MIRGYHNVPQTESCQIKYDSSLTEDILLQIHVWNAEHEHCDG